MIDPFGRPITYLRVSVTDRCDLRCVYCMAEDMTFLPRRDLLTLEELDRLCAAFIRLGTTKIRITGGEPLVRRDVMRLFGQLGQRIGHGRGRSVQFVAKVMLQVVLNAVGAFERCAFAGPFASQGEDADVEGGKTEVAGTLGRCQRLG